MTICSKNHAEIDYDGRYSLCPLCEALDKLAEAEAGIEEKDAEIKKLKGQIDELLA